jgi:hypothetical protein
MWLRISPILKIKEVYSLQMYFKIEIFHMAKYDGQTQEKGGKNSSYLIHALILVTTIFYTFWVSLIKSIPMAL